MHFNRISSHLWESLTPFHMSKSSHSLVAALTDSLVKNMHLLTMPMPHLQQ